MDITITRNRYTPHSTQGELEVDGIFQCYTLEDTARVFKIPGKTCIDAGTYNVIITPSNRFRDENDNPRLMPLLEKVPNFDGVRIHSGNTDKDTDGCILVGNVRQEDAIYESRTAFITLFAKIKSALETDNKVTLTIKDMFKPTL